jgi:uncharacterized protein
MTLISPDLISEIRNQYRLNWNGIHGSAHFLRVRDNGIRLAETTGAKIHVVQLFAFLHDSMRENDRHDPDHGKRAAQFARQLQGRFFKLTSEELDLLSFACEFHTDGFIDGNVTVQTCWDSDRLDLGRVEKRPTAGKLCTAAAKTPEIIEWAYKRIISR